MRDLFHSIRGKFNRCEYYLRNEQDSVGDLSQWVINKTPKGVFYAKPINARNNQAIDVNNVIMFNRDAVMIETEDETPLLERGCIVKFKNTLWFVDNVQKDPHIKETEFSLSEHYTTVISLRK